MTASRDGRRGRMHCRRTGPSTSSKADRIPIRGSEIETRERQVLCAGIDHLSGRTPALLGQRDRARKGSPSPGHPGKIVSEDAGSLLRGRRGGSHRPDLLTKRAGSSRRPGSASTVVSAGLSTTRAPGLPLLRRRRSQGPSPLGTSLFTMVSATIGCTLVSAQLPIASLSIDSHLQERSRYKHVRLLARLRKKRKPLGCRRRVLPVGKKGVSTAPPKD